MWSPSDSILDSLKFDFVLQFFHHIYLHNFPFPIKILISLTCFALIWLCWWALFHINHVNGFFFLDFSFSMVVCFVFWHFIFILNFMFYLFYVFTLSSIVQNSLISLIWKILYYKCGPTKSISNKDALQDILW